MPTPVPPATETARHRALAALLCLGLSWATHAAAQPGSRLTAKPLPEARVDWQLAVASSDHLTRRTAELPTSEAATPADVAPLAAPATAEPPSPWGRLGHSLRTFWTRVQERMPWHDATSNDAALVARQRGLLAPLDNADEGGFRAVAGLSRPESSNWWITHGERYSGLSASYQRLSAAGVLSAGPALATDPNSTTRPYLGAGYSSRLATAPSGNDTPWRFQADVGLLSLQDGTPARNSASSAPNGDLDGLMRDMRLRPNVKVSVGYSF